MKGTVPVLEDLNFKIKTGELVAVIGPVGAGKVIYIPLWAQYLYA